MANITEISFTTRMGGNTITVSAEVEEHETPEEAFENIVAFAKFQLAQQRLEEEHEYDDLPF